MSLSEDTLEQSSARLWAMRIVIALALIGVVVGLTLALKKMVSTPDAPKRQVAKVTLLPNTPPPPPPPKVEEVKPTPKDEPQATPDDQPKPKEAAPPADAPLKMEGAAGDGPSAFAAGSVSKDYAGGPISSGASAPAGTPIDRAQERFYANAVRQMLRDEIEKHLRPEAGELTATFSIWVENDGRIRRYEVLPSGNSNRDQDMQGALDGAQRGLRLPAPGALAQPMRFRLTVRPLA